jgi:hypothetical protein
VEFKEESNWKLRNKKKKSKRNTRGTQEIKRNQSGIQCGNQEIKVEFQCGNQKTSNKLKTKNKNLGCLVEKMSQVLR